MLLKIIQIVINDLDIDNSLETSQQTILLRTQRWLGEGFGWIIESIDGDYIKIPVYNPVARSSYMQLSEELRHSRKGSINIENENNEYFH